jgi:hypothetical protein
LLRCAQHLHGSASPTKQNFRPNAFGGGRKYDLRVLGVRGLRGTHFLNSGRSSRCHGSMILGWSEARRCQSCSRRWRNSTRAVLRKWARHLNLRKRPDRASRSPVGHRLYAEREDAGCMVGLQAAELASVDETEIPTRLLHRRSQRTAPSTQVIDPRRLIDDSGCLR